MTDLNEQAILAEQPVFISGFADGEQAPCPIGDTNYSLAPISDAPDAKSSPDDTLPDDGGELAKEPEILSRLAVDLEMAGLAGELRTAKIINLAATSRLFSQPLLSP